MIMNNTFLENYRQMRNNNWKEETDKAFDSLISDNFKKNLRGKEKLKELGSYDGESILGDTALYPGTIYIFKYKADNPTVYNDGSVKFEFYDSLPVCLITGATRNVISGINLNFCTPEVRANIINILYNMDPYFYIDGGAEEKASRGGKPISDNVIKTFIEPGRLKNFYEVIKKECNLKNTSLIFRAYNIKNIQAPRLVETWQYKYIPFLRYNGELKQEILSLIYKISGMTV